MCSMNEEKKKWTQNFYSKPLAKRGWNLDITVRIILKRTPTEICYEDMNWLKTEFNDEALVWKISHFWVMTLYS